VSRAERIHKLFNELYQALDDEAKEAKSVAEGIVMGQYATRVDAIHHDYTNLTLQEIA
jgi:hypothetical protein